MEGILLVNKPKGPTSFQIIKHLRNVTGERKIGHTGTLDPAARGLLIILIGKATKHAQCFQEMRKRYIAKIQLGICTATDDREGAIITQKKTEALPFELIVKTLQAFSGRILQRPPQHSAVKHHGRRAYELARQGQSFELKAREVTVYSIDMIYYHHPFIKVAICCSKGTYVRSIARDLGERLGTGAILHSLIRTHIGKWNITESLSHRDLCDGHIIAQHLLPIEKGLTASNDTPPPMPKRYPEKAAAS